MKWFHCTVGDDVINTKNKSAGIKLMIKMSKWTNNSRRSSGKERLANNSHYWNGLATIAIGESLRIPAVVLDHVRQFYDELAFLIFLARFERVLLSISNNNNKQSVVKIEFNWTE